MSADRGDDVVVVLGDDRLGQVAAVPADPDVVVLRDGEGEPLPKHAQQLDGGCVRLPFLRGPYELKFRQGSTGEITVEAFSELVMRRLTGGDLIASQNSGDKGSLTLLSRSSGIKIGKMEALHDKMDAEDILAAFEVIAFFLPSGRAKAGS